MAKPLVALEHSVVDVDASENMRRFANEEVMVEAFTAISPAMLDQLLDAGLQFDLAGGSSQSETACLDRLFY